MSITLPDDSTRPKAPKIEGVSDQQRRRGRGLAKFHAMHLRHMAHVNQIMEQVFAGNGSAEALLTSISSMQMVSNMRQFGNLCGATCQMLTGHHSIEDQWMFPALHGHTEGLDKVVARLRYEHTFIHQLIVQLEDSARALINEAGAENAKTLRAHFRALENFVISHFGYEQTELEEALGFYDIEM